MANPIVQCPQQGRRADGDHAPEQESRISRVREKAPDPLEKAANRLQRLAEPVEEGLQPCRRFRRLCWWREVELNCRIVAHCPVRVLEAIGRADRVLTLAANHTLLAL